MQQNCKDSRSITFKNNTFTLICGEKESEWNIDQTVLRVGCFCFQTNISHDFGLQLHPSQRRKYEEITCIQICKNEVRELMDLKNKRGDVPCHTCFVTLLLPDKQNLKPISFAQIINSLMFEFQKN